LDEFPHKRSNDFFMSWIESIFASLCRRKLEKDINGIPSIGFFPVFSRTKSREEYFARSYSIHLFSHDIFDVSEGFES
jgi:hypothetical protein